IYVNSGIYILVLALTLLVVKKFPDAKARNSSGKKQFLLRSAFAGTIILAAVIVAKYAGPLWGAIIVAFPASYFSTSVISTKDHGIEFTKAVIRAAPLATLGTLFYYFVVYWTYPILGIYLGTLLGYAVALAYILIAEKVVPVAMARILKKPAANN
ncbi:MAG: hypothetical protein AABW99_04415, partial [archaeon]